MAAAPRPKVHRWLLLRAQPTQGPLADGPGAVAVLHNCADYGNFISVTPDTFATGHFYACCPACGAPIPAIFLIQAHLLAAGP